MSAKTELETLGFEVKLSIESPVKNWGTWMVSARKGIGRVVNGYGTDEESALINALVVAKEAR